MNDAQFAELAAWIAAVGLAGESEPEMVAGFCTRAVQLGLPLARGSVLIDTLHPHYEGHAVNWQAADGKTTLREYGFSSQGEAAERWQRSPFYRMVQTGEPLLRRRVNAESQAEFPVIADLAAGMTDFVAMVHRFAAQGIFGEMDSIYSSWATDLPDGFGDADIADLERLVPLLALAVKSASLTRIARTLVETYLGRDPGRRVLAGGIVRGVADRIESVLWFSDLRGYTRITDTSPPEQVIPLLNDYADAIISAIHAHGGDVLKLIGDGTLAIFTSADREQACREALAAAREARRSLTELNLRRGADGLPTTDMYLALHFGTVFYGNIGSKERLDFTVIGPAVNEVSRIATLCRSIEQPILLSATFAAAAGKAKDRLVSVGRYALRGVSHPQELFTLDPTSRE
ncbi:MAG: adenylate/guanylate cyclase domain-containing protein [Xanthobacteraceae bacterium]